MIKNRAIVIIDGSNFYFKLKTLGFSKFLYFDFSSFIKSIIKKDKLIYSCYYIGRIRNDGTRKSKELFVKQRKLLTHLRNQNIKFSLGYLLKIGNTYYEKGVDVQMAVDILKGAYRDIYDKAYLLSSDSDLLPAIIEAQAVGKTIVYVGFRHKISYALLNNCKKTLLLEKKDVLPFLSSNIKR